MTCDRVTNLSPLGGILRRLPDTVAPLSSLFKKREKNMLDECNHVTRSNDNHDPFAR